jgi:hypothetical protein
MLPNYSKKLSAKSTKNSVAGEKKNLVTHNLVSLISDNLISWQKCQLQSKYCKFHLDFRKVSLINDFW